MSKNDTKDEKDEKDSANKLDITNSKEQTKNWRKACDWYKNGKSNECEIYQKKLIKQLIGYIPSKTNDRFYMETKDIINKTNPMKDKNGFEFTEDFDGKVITKTHNKINNTIYFNLKFCCDAGGAQTRTLREVYHFIKCQIEYVIKKQKEINDSSGLFDLSDLSDSSNSSEIYFINILDGDTSYKNMDKFKYLLEKEKKMKQDMCEVINKYIFIGSMLEFSTNKKIIDLCKHIE